MKVTSLRKLLAFFLFLIFLFLLLEIVSDFSFFSLAKGTFQPQDFSGGGKVFVYVVSYLFILTNLTLLLLMKKGKLFTLFLLLISITFLIDASYYQNGLSRGFSSGQFVTAYNEYSHISSAVSAFYGGFIKSIAFLAGILFGTFFLRKFFSFRFFFMPLIALPLSFIGGNYIIQHTMYRIYNYPSFVKVPLSVFNAFNDGLLNIPYVKRNVLTVLPSTSPDYRNIILIIDESVRGDYLSINGFDKETTPFLNSLGDKVLSLGSIPSVANDSGATNYILRNGVTLEELPDRQFLTLKKPTIFQYAQKAGYKTALLDAQVSYGVLQNAMSNYDLEAIDKFETLRNVTDDSMRDHLMVDRLANIISSGNNFIYFVKYGSHFQWKTTYPVEQEFFTPTLFKGESLSFSRRVEAVNTYQNSLRWGVDSFFEYLLNTVNTQDTLIIYTSDHGQNILKDNILVTHGLDKDPPSTMARVPLLMYENDINQIRNKFNKLIPNTYTQYQLFPSLLSLMGYGDDVITQYGVPFWEGGINKRQFYSGSPFGEGYINDFK